MHCANSSFDGGLLTVFAKDGLQYTAIILDVKSFLKTGVWKLPFSRMSGRDVNVKDCSRS